MKHYHIISRVAIYMLSVVLIIFGIFHFLYPRDLFVYVPVFMVGGIMYAYIVGGLFVIVGLSFLTNQYVKFSSYLLVVLMLIFILSIHLPNYLNAGNRDTEIAALINILKDTAIMGFVYCILLQVRTINTCTSMRVINHYFFH